MDSINTKTIEFESLETVLSIAALDIIYGVGNEARALLESIDKKNQKNKD